MSDGSCRVVGLLSILWVPTEYQSLERLCATILQWLSGSSETGRITAAAGRKSPCWEMRLGQPSPAKPDAGRLPVTNLAVHIRVGISRRFSELAVFDARLYVRVSETSELIYRELTGRQQTVVGLGDAYSRFPCELEGR